MDQLINHKHRIDFLISNDTLSQPTQTTQTTVKLKRKKILCNECNKRPLDGSHQVCNICYKAKTIYKPSGNRVIDEFIKYTLINGDRFSGRMEFVSYDQFKDIEFIAEGGFSKIYKATWIDGRIYCWDNLNQSYKRKKNCTVVLKKLNNSKEITSKDLNELKIFYEFSLNWKKHYKVRPSYDNQWNQWNNISKNYGITQDPITQDVMIVMPYYESGDLINYITSEFYKISWKTKLFHLRRIIIGLENLHSINIVHQDFHSGNIFFSKVRKGYYSVFIGDLGLSKSATESSDNNENYGIIPYMAPEIFQGQKYTKASDIYSFGMIMWEFMTGRRPFWDRVHDIELIIEICDGLRPPIVTNAPEGYVDLIKECWHSDPKKRPTAADIYNKINKMCNNEWINNWNNPNKITKIIESSDIGPVTENNPGAIYKSRLLGDMIKSAMYTRNLRSQSVTSGVGNVLSFNAKRRSEDNPIENDINNGKCIKKIKLIENKNNDYATQEFELDI